jgi:hypothetical protein
MAEDCTNWRREQRSAPSDAVPDENNIDPLVLSIDADEVDRATTGDTWAGHRMRTDTFED